MINLADINPISTIIVLLFALPLLAGAFAPFTREKVRYSLGGLLDNLEFMTAFVLAVYVTGRLLTDGEGTVFHLIYSLLPESLKALLNGQQLLSYVIFVPVIMLLCILVMMLVTSPLYRRVVVPFSERLHRWVQEGGGLRQKLTGTLWQLPKALFLPLIFIILLNIFSYFFYAPALTEWINQSRIYGLAYEHGIKPLTSSSLAKRIPVLAENTLDAIFEREASQDPSSQGSGAGENSKWNIRVIKYFNGVTLDEAVKSNAEIDHKAREITEGKKDDKDRAYALYKWVTRNVEYDFEKAENIVENSQSYESGAIPAFETGKGICFDYSALYVAMCRAVGLKVRLITGTAYSGSAWGDHAWNQVYSEEEARWLDIDATFGSSGVNYFDKQGFSEDHRNAVVQGEW